MGMTDDAITTDARRSDGGDPSGVPADAGRVGGHSRNGAGSGSAVRHRIAIEADQARRVLLSLADDIDGDALLAASAVALNTSLPEAVDEALQRLAEIDGMAAVLAERIKSMQTRKKRLEVQSERIRETLATALGSTHTQRLERPTGTVALTRTPQTVIITDAAALPAGMVRQPEPEPDKIAIKRALLVGQRVPGATLSNGSVTVTIKRN